MEDISKRKFKKKLSVKDDKNYLLQIIRKQKCIQKFPLNLKYLVEKQSAHYYLWNLRCLNLNSFISNCFNDTWDVTRSNYFAHMHHVDMCCKGCRVQSLRSKLIISYKSQIFLCLLIQRIKQSEKILSSPLFIDFFRFTFFNCFLKYSILFYWK